MKIVSLHSKEDIETVLRTNLPVHIYEIGDLDDFFWPFTTWYAGQHDNFNKEILLIYNSGNTPTLLAFASDVNNMQATLQSACHLLPTKMIGHLSSGCLKALEKYYTIDTHGTFVKMINSSPDMIKHVKNTEVIRLTMSDLPGLLSLYSEAYPSGWFDQRMLETKQFFGIKKENRIVSVAGIHVYSKHYRVAAIGNVVTHPDFRNKGYCTLCISRICSSLFETVDHIGLNVQKDNFAAIKCYERNGFRTIAEYQECKLDRIS